MGTKWGVGYHNASGHFLQQSLWPSYSYLSPSQLFSTNTSNRPMAWADLTKVTLAAGQAAGARQT